VPVEDLPGLLRLGQGEAASLAVSQMTSDFVALRVIEGSIQEPG
jgi:hypothetical protein